MAEETTPNQNIVPSNVTPETQSNFDPLAPNADLFQGILDSPQESADFNFDKVSENLFADQDIESIFASQVDPGWTPGMEAASKFVNTGYTPVYTSPQQQSKDVYDANSQSTVHQLMQKVYSQPSSVSDKLSPNNAVTFGYKSSNFDRYYNHTNFDELGFHPYRDNETYYNENSTWWEDNQRMWGQFGKVFSTGFMSTWDAIGDAFSGNYLQADVDGGDNFAEAMRIGNTTRGGVGGFATNLMLNSGYTVGILSNIAVEEFALAGLEAITFGGATPLVASRTAYNLVRGGRAIDKLRDTGNASEVLLKSMKNADNAKGFWTRAGIWTADLLTPQTYKALKSWKTTQNTAQMLTTSAKVAKTAGGFYRDMRMVNLAMAESKLEAGMVKNDLINEYYSDFKVNNNGSEPTPEDIEKMVNKADEAAFTTTMWNFPIIYFSNKIVFDGALRGFRGTKKLLEATKKGIGGRILKSTPKQMKKGGKAFYDGGASRWSRFIKRGFSGNLKTFGGALLKYTMPNSVEGFQEIFQEAIAVGAKDYYTNIYNDPAAGGFDAQLASIQAGLSSQWSGHGFEVFMSGFLMGGLVQGPQKLVFEGGPALYERWSDPEGYAEYVKKRDDYINETVKTLNEVYENPEKYFDPEKINALNQKILNESMFVSSFEGSVLGFYDAKDASIFHAIHTVLSAGKAHEFRSEIEDFLKLDDQGLAEAFPNATAEEIKSGKTRERLNKMLTNLNDAEESFKKLNEQLENPYDESRFEKGTREWNEEVIKKAAFNHAKMLALYTRKTFQRALERSNQIYKDMSEDPVIANMQSSDLDVLTSMNDLIQEIDLLKTELRIAEEAEGDISPEQKEINKKKRERLGLLQNYFGALTDPKNIEKKAPVFVPKEGETPEEESERKKNEAVSQKIIEKVRQDILSTGEVNTTEAQIAMLAGTAHPFGMFNAEKIGNLKDSFVKFLQFASESNEEFINSDKIDETLLRIVDHKFLKGRAEDYNKAIQFIMSPGKLNELSDKFNIKFTEAFEQNKRDVRGRMEKYVDQTEKNNFLNALANLDVYPDAVEVEKWLKGEGPRPEKFFNKKGEVIFTDPENKALAEKIENIIGTYENTARKKEAESRDVEEQDDFEDPSDDQYNYDENFTPKVDEDTGEILEDDIDFESSVSLGKQYLAKQYTKYQRGTKGTPMTYRDWLESSASKQARKVAFTINKLNQEVFGPAKLKGEKADFNEWLMTNENSDEVQNIVKLTGVSVEQITGESTKKVPKKFDKSKNTKRKKVAKGHSSGINVQEVTQSIHGEDKTMYRLVDNNSDPIEDDVYSSAEEATNARNKKVRTKKKETSYEFAGETLKKDDIVQNKEGDKFIVQSQKSHVDKKGNLWVRPRFNPNSKKKADQTYIEEQEFIDDWTVVTDEIIEDDVKISKLLTREPLQIFPKKDLSIKNKEERTKEANERLQEILRNLTPEQQQSIKIKIKRGPQWDNRQTDVSKLQSFSFQQDEVNNRIKLQKQKLWVEILLEKTDEETGKVITETIGFFQGPSSSILLDGNGKVIDPLQITKQQAYDLFRTWNEPIENTVDKIKNNYAQAIAIEEFLQTLLNNSGQEEVIIDIAELEEIGVTLSEGALTRVTTKGETGVTFGELDYKYVVPHVEGTDYSDITTDGQPPFFIMDYNRDYPAKTKDADGKWVYSKTKGVPITNIDPLKPAGKKLFQQVSATWVKMESKSKNLKGKYQALVKLNNDKDAIVTLTPDTMIPEDVDNLLNLIKERSKDTHDNHYEDPTYNTKWNKEFNNGSPVDSPFNLPGVFIAAGAGIFISLDVNMLGGLNVNIRDFNKSQKSKLHRQQSVIDFEAVQEWNTAEDMIAALTAEGFTPFQPTMNSFKYPIQKEGIDFNILSLARTNLTAEVKDSFYITLNLEGSGMSKLTTPVIRKSNEQKEKEEIDKEIEKKNEEKVEKLTPEQKQDIILDDYKNIDASQLKLIAVKLNTNQELDEFEKRVLNAHRETIEAYRLEMITEDLNPADTPVEAENQKALDEYARIEKELKEHIKNLRDVKRAELIARNPELYNENTGDGRVAINRVLYELVKTDPTTIALRADLKKAKEDSFKARKITKNFDGNDIEDIDTFIDWLRANLPEGLIEIDLDMLSEKMKNDFKTVGSFTLAMTNIAKGIEGLRGVINTSALAPFKYHEAFHSVFRMLLTDEEITKYLGIAKKELRALYRTKKGYEIDPGVFVKSEAEALDFLRSIHPGYAEMNVKELSDILYEEYIADRFEEFKMNPATTKTNTEIKSLFTRIIEWIKSVLGQFKADKQSQLNSLFKDIDGGKYKKAGIQSNKFTIAAAEGSPIIAYKKSISLGTIDVPYEDKSTGKIKRKIINHNMPGDQQHDIISAITNLYLKRRRNTTGKFDKNAQLEEAVLFAIEMYNPTRTFYMSKSEEFQAQEIPYIDNMYNSMLDQVDDIKEMVNERLADVAQKINLEEEDIEELEADGIRDVNEWGKSSDEIGGFSTMLDPNLREYISLTTLNQADVYGNEYFDDAETEPLNIGVDPHSVYNGILKAVANEIKEIEILKKAWIYSRKNPHSKAFIDKFFLDIGLFDAAMSDEGKTAVLFDDNFTLPKIKNSELYQQFINGFKNFRVDNIFWQKDTSGIVHLYSATTKDDAHHTLSEWANMFNRKYRSVKIIDSEEHSTAVTTLTALKQLLAIKEIGENSDLSSKSSTIADMLMNNLGMAISPLYIEYSVLSNILDQSNFTPEQKLLVDTFEMYEAMTEVDVDEIMKSINRGENIFLDNQDTEGQDATKKAEFEGVKSKLIKLSLNNSPFSESVGATVFKDPKGNLIYAHQMPTLHLEKLIEMKGPDYVAEKMLESPFMEANILLNDPKFRIMVEQGLIKPMRISGLKSGGILNISEQGIIRENKGLDVNRLDGVQFGEATPKDFMLSLIHTYLYFYNRTSPDKTITLWDGADEFAMTLTFLRVIEASNTGDFSPTPIYKAIERTDEGLGLTDEAVEKRKKIVKQIFERAQREANPETREKQKIYLGNTDQDNNRTDTGRLTSMDEAAVLLNTLKARSNRSISVNTPNIGEKVSDALVAGDIKTLLRSPEAAANTNLSVGENAVVDIKGMQFVMYNQGSKKFSDLTNEEQSKLLEDMGTSIVEGKPKKGEKMYGFRVGNKQYYTYLFKDAQWLNDKSTTLRNVFSFVPLSEDSKVQLGFSTDDMKAKAVEELYERADTAMKEGNKDLARILLDKAKNLEAEENPVEAMDVDTSVLDGLQAAVEKAREGEMVDFDTLWEELNGDNAIRTRAMQNVNELIITLKETGAYQEISREISEGLGQVQENNKKRLHIVQNDRANQLMDIFNMKEQDLDYNLAQIFLLDHTNTIGINQLILGDEAYSLKDAIDKIKRAKMQNAAGPSASSIIVDEELGIHHETDIIKQLLFEDELIKREFETIIEADRQKEGSLGERSDGQMYITMKAFKHFMFGFGKWNKAKKEIWEKIAAGETVAIDEEFFGNFNELSYKEKDMIMNSLKLVYADGQTFLKMSAFVLTPAFTSVKRNGEWVARDGREELHNLRVKLEKFEGEQLNEGNGIVSIAVPASASKMMKANMQDTQAAYDAEDLTNDMTTDLQAKYMRLQLINPSNKVEIIDPRQIKNLITSEQKLDEIVWIGGKEMSIADVITMYHTNMSDRVENEFFKRRNLVFSWGGALNEMIKAKDAGKRMTTNLTAFLKYAIKGLEASQAKTQMLDYFGMDEFGEPQYDLNNQLTVQKFQELFLSFFGKGVLAERQPGISASLVSDAGFKVIKKVLAIDENGTPIRWQVIRSDDWENMKTEKPGIKISRYTDASNETFSGLNIGDYYIDHLRSNVMKYNDDGTPSGIRYTEFVMPPHFKSILTSLNIDINEPLPDAIAKMFGIRIPSQDKHSAVNLMLVDFLPVYYGSSAIFSRDLVEISGADFDIDKLYMHIKDFYVRKGEFIEYGSATNEKDAYQDYIRFTINEYGKKNSSLNMAVEEYLRREKSIENAERIGIDENTANMTFNEKQEFLKEYLKDKELKIKMELFALLTQDTDLTVQMATRLYERAEGLEEGMKMLGLPVSEKEYKEYKEKYNGKEPYRAAQDNKILDAKFALLGNAGMTDPRKGRITGVASEPAVLTPLTDENAVDIVGEGVWQYIQRELPELAEEVNEEGIDINNFNGKMIAWDNNKEGARSIGAVVLPNILINILQENGITLRTKKSKGTETFPRLSFNGNNYDYDNFGIEYTINPQTGKEDVNLHRKQFVVSALVTAMTDNAKERLAKKLGLTKNSLATVTTMLALGVDIKTITLMIKHPTIAYAFDQIKNNKVIGNIRTVLEKRKNSIKKVLEGDYKDPAISIESLTKMNKHLNAINDGVPKLDKSQGILTVGIPEGDIDGWTRDELLFDLAVINQFTIAYDITESLRQMTELVNLQKGLGRDLEAMQRKQDAAESLGLLMSNKEFEQNTDILVDVRDIFLKGRGIHATNYKLFRESYDYLAPAIFLQRTKSYEKISNTLIKNLHLKFSAIGKKSSLSTDLTAYLNTKSYIHRVINDSYESWQQESLTNSMIYENKHFPIMPENGLNIATVVKRTQKYLEDNNISNYFINNYVTLRETNNEDNQSGITQLNANTWTRLNDAEIANIQNSLLELYQDPNTHHDVVHMINYLLVKDGFRYGPNTFMSAIPAALTKDILNTIHDIHLLMKNDNINNDQYKKLFGVTYEELITEFLEDYMSHIKTDYNLKSIKVGGEVSTYNTEEIVIPEHSILVDWNSEEGEGNTQVLSNLAPREFEYDGNTYGSVIHAFQVLRKGKFDKKVNKEYMKNGIENAHGKIIETKLSKKRGFNEDALLKQLIIKSFINSGVGYESQGIEIRLELVRHSDFTFMTNDNISKITRDALLSVQKDLVYNNKENGEQTIISRSGINTQKTKNKTLAKNAVVRDNTEGTMDVDLLKGMSNKKDADNSSRRDQNRQNIKNSGFKLIKVQGKKGMVTQVEFPYIIKVGLGRAGLKNPKTYKLVSIRTLDNKTITDPYELIDNKDNIAIGTSAKYIEIDQVGSTSQWAGGGVLGVLPSAKDINEYLENKKDIFNDVKDPSDEVDVDNVVEEVDVDNVTPESQTLDNMRSETETEETMEEEEAEETEVDVDDVDVEDIQVEDENIPDATSFFAGSITEQAKTNPEDSKLEKEWDKLTPEQKLNAANLLKMYSYLDLIDAYNKTNSKVDISVSKFMENLKCRI